MVHLGIAYENLLAKLGVSSTYGFQEQCVHTDIQVSRVIYSIQGHLKASEINLTNKSDGKTQLNESLQYGIELEVPIKNASHKFFAIN